ncbi:MAG TPA: hypothetical protein VIJ51_19720, partial [Solirubrobacteraceae bacterium]
MGINPPACRRVYGEPRTPFVSNKVRVDHARQTRFSRAVRRAAWHSRTPTGTDPFRVMFRGGAVLTPG